MRIAALVTIGIVLFLAPLAAFYVSRGYFPHSAAEFAQFFVILF